MRHFIDEIRRLRSEFGRDARRRRLAALRAAGRGELSDPRTLLEYHEQLLFIAAYPDDAIILRAAAAELRRVAKAAGAITAEGRAAGRRALSNSGIAGTACTGSFSIELLAWLVEKLGATVELVWEDGSAGEALEHLLLALVEHVEGDGLLAGGLSTHDWVKLAAGRGGRETGWLVRRLHALECREAARDPLVETLDLHVTWPLRQRDASRTFARMPARQVCYQTGDLERGVDLKEVVARPLPPTRRVAAGDARRLIDLARATLCVRQRETDPITYANPREVTLLRLERGIDVALYGALPRHRQPVESYFGFVVARNRVPIGYGGGWVLFERAEIGVNVFDTFRGGESAYAFAQVMRVYHHHYGARRFSVDPYQFGAGNTEAIRSGAFWFYHRLGFRPVEPRARALAEREWARTREDRTYRSPAAVLRRLARSPIAWDVGDVREPPTDTPALTHVGLAVTEWIGRKYAGDRGAAVEAAARRACGALGVSDLASWPADERWSFGQFSLLAAMIPNLPHWSAGEKRDLVRVMRAKGGPAERVYVRVLRNHTRFRAALCRIARAGGAVERRVSARRGPGSA